MSYGRILLIAALVFGGLYYYHSNELDRQRQEHINQLEREREAREAAKYEREAERDRQQLEREKAEAKAADKAFAVQIEKDYRRCFHRLPPKSFSSMDNVEQLKFINTVYPNVLNDERAICDR
jgi:hypothetical protein